MPRNREIQVYEAIYTKYYQSWYPGYARDPRGRPGALDWFEAERPKNDLIQGGLLDCAADWTSAFANLSYNRLT